MATTISDKSSGFVGEPGDSGSCQSGEQADGREGRPPGVGSLLSQDVEDDPRGEVELVQEEVVGMDDLDVQGIENGRRIVAHVGTTRRSTEAGRRRRRW